MEEPFDFENLFVLDLANNHQGSVKHGLAVIDAMADQVDRHGVRAGMKFQFRQLDSFVHPAHRSGSDNKHIPRFLSTELSRQDFEALRARVEDRGLTTIVTPFDEESVTMAVEMGFEILKVASCSARDWPLLEAVASAGKPVIFSTGGLDIADIDNLVSFFSHRMVDFAVMHCVSIYPTPSEHCQLNQIDVLRDRYPERTIGWSTHEDQDDTAPLFMAYAKGARMFERHVGLPTDKVTLNAYSSNPDQVDRWFAAHAKAVALCGATEGRPITDVERQSLDGLKRGVFARRPLKPNSVLSRDDVYFAMPLAEGQLSSGEWREGFSLKAAVKSDGVIAADQVEGSEGPRSQILKTAIHEVKAMLNKARIVLGPEFSVEYSHHYGIERFRETGAILIDCVNREYCKKLIIQLPGQSHPFHFHPRKEETFQVLSGELYAEIDGHQFHLRPGETALVLPGVWHRFWTESGAIFEEVSTTHYNDDSRYKDPEIQAKSREERKTRVDHWGRFILDDKIVSIGDGA